MSPDHDAWGRQLLDAAGARLGAQERHLQDGPFSEANTYMMRLGQDREWVGGPLLLALGAAAIPALPIVQLLGVYPRTRPWVEHSYQYAMSVGWPCLAIVERAASGTSRGSRPQMLIPQFVH